MLRIALPQSTGRAAWLAATCLVGLIASSAQAHFIWITAEAPSKPGQPSKIHAFLNEEPEPGGPEFLKYVQGLVPTTSGLPLPMTIGEASATADWVGPLPTLVDAERDLGLKTKGDVTYRLYYNARLQTQSIAETVAEKGTKLRARVITKDSKPVVQVL